MFARVSTYETSPESRLDEASTKEITDRVLALPGNRGIYFLTSTEPGKALSITLWDSADSLSASQQAANTIRADASSEQAMRIVGVEEFEVSASSLKD
ncbi:hypothetical protein SAMN05216282_11631 [Cryobacterium psychrotolerans]|uniref:ABM domain-containing protein n=1 Tax=Cryobacterium psychrotolerans TaxID=386301 RepID=A0A1G9FHR2_9MICO|nr:MULTISPECIES: hypothetical protein [Cryobacterium]TFD41680.1 hypothetical protein E3T33_13435 [Cryobacterium sp. TMT1-2-1]TFD83807.1 hypothetical protein E3T56_11840 [Cryobacterium psychrotolerans]SDK87930.1 hypothetical protein SAMN05216282_11631 [Cryobacterium psychrotolerans]